MNNKLFAAALCTLLCTMTCYRASAQSKPILTLTSTCPDIVQAGDTISLVLTVDVVTPWYVYAPGSASGAPGIQPMRLKFAKLPAALKAVGQLKHSMPMPKGPSLVYMGKGHTLTQQFVLDATAPSGPMTLQGELIYQACNDETCLPEMGETISKTLQVAAGGTPAMVASVDQDWDALERSTNLFADTETSAQYESLAPLAMKRFEDAGYQRKANLAYAFWQQYPSDQRRMYALKIYLSADPFFIAKHANESLEHVKSWKGLDSKAFMRSIVIDSLARTAWLLQGEEMATSILRERDSSITAKETASFLLFARDYRLAARDYRLRVIDDEGDYWSPYYRRFLQHINTYSNQQNLGDRAKDFLSSLKGISPSIAAHYWLELQQLTVGKQQEDAGIASLREAAKEHLHALALEAGTTPVEMAFTTLPGEQFSLKDLRGKVVLIDFWATWCKPCLDELPHVKAMYDKYHKLGFEVVGICLDDESARARAMGILEKQGIAWPQRFEGKGFSSDTYRLLYGINSLPTVWLLDKEGKITDRNARGEKLEQLIIDQLKLNGES